jgi:hypothetical protein
MNGDTCEELEAQRQKNSHPTAKLREIGIRYRGKQVRARKKGKIT